MSNISPLSIKSSFLNIGNSTTATTLGMLGIATNNATSITISHTGTGDVITDGTSSWTSDNRLINFSEVTSTTITDGIATLTAGSLAGITTISMSGQLTSNVTTGTAPFVISSITKVNNLNADKVDGYDMDQSLLTTASPTFASITITNTINEFSIDGTLSGNSDTAIPTEKAVKTYVDSSSGSSLWSLTGSDISPIGSYNVLKNITGNIGSSSVPWNSIFSSNLNILGVSNFTLGATNTVYIDASTTAKTAGNALDISIKAGGDSVNGIYISSDINGHIDFRSIKVTTTGTLLPASNIATGIESTLIGSTSIAGSTMYAFRATTDAGGGATHIGFSALSGFSYGVYSSSPVKIDSTIQMATGSTINEFSIDGTLSGNSDTALPTEKAVKTYVDSSVGSTTFTGLTDTPSTYTTANAIYTTNGTPNSVIETGVVLTEGTNTFNISKGTASLNIAIGKTLNINNNLTVNTNSVILNQSLQTTDSPTFSGLTIVNTINEISIDGTLIGNSDTAIPTEKAVKTYVDSSGGGSTTFTGLTDTPSTYTTANALYSINGSSTGIIETTVTVQEGVNTFTLTEGTSVFTVNATSTIDQDLQMSSSPMFTSLILTGSTDTLVVQNGNALFQQLAGDEFIIESYTGNNPKFSLLDDDVTTDFTSFGSTKQVWRVTTGGSSGGGALFDGFSVAGNPAMTFRGLNGSGSSSQNLSCLRFRFVKSNGFGGGTNLVGGEYGVTFQNNDQTPYFTIKGDGECEFLHYNTSTNALTITDTGQGNTLKISSSSRTNTNSALNLIYSTTTTSNAYAMRLQSDNSGAGLPGGLDLASMSAGEPNFRFINDIATTGTYYGRVAIEISGIGIKYLSVYN